MAIVSGRDYIDFGITVVYNDELFPRNRNHPEDHAMPKSKPKARPAAAPPEPAPAPAKQPSSGARHPVLSFRVTPECVALLDEMTAYYEVSRREIIDRALREFHRGEFAASLAKARKGR